VLRDGTAIAPDNAPDVVKRVIMAGNEIAKFPYKWGGGHGAWRDNGYDCSGSVSFALAGAGLLGRPLTSGLFMNYGAPGPGHWITIYPSPGHIFMYVAGLRFDTSGQGRAGTRWQEDSRSTAGFAVRHIPGL
jgi:cell wall-associated NlpC family hydrolase